MELKVYTLEEAAELLKLSKHTLRKHIEAGKLKASKVGKHLRITQQQILEYLKENERG